jgi:hypothetical protein
LAVRSAHFWSIYRATATTTYTVLYLTSYYRHLTVATFVKKTFKENRRQKRLKNPL